jgi:SAM-dependent methyltransferase
LIYLAPTESPCYDNTMSNATPSEAHAKQAADRFDDWAESYGDDRISGWFQHYQQAALDKFAFTGSERFLDVGCGTGWAVRQAATSLPNGSAHGIDISPAMVKKATGLSQAIRNCEFSEANSESIPHEDKYFDSILCTFSFHHYQDPIAALSEFKRVLKDDGMLVIVDSARDVSFAIWLQDRGRRYLERSHVKYYTVKELKSLVEKSGFAIKEDIHTESGFMRFGKAFTGLMFQVCRKA